MELFQANAFLVKELISESPDVWEYLLYSETYTNHSQYVADDFSQTVFSLNNDGHYEISLDISKDSSIDVDLDLIKPVIHIVRLEGLELSSNYPTIEIAIKEGGQLKGKKRKIHKSSADENGRPI